MKRTFTLSHPKIKVPRLVEAAKHEVRKYLKRERRRALPAGVDFWDFNCRFGVSEEAAKPVHLAELSKRMDEAEAAQAETFYVEIVAKPGHRLKKPTPSGSRMGPSR